MNDTPVVGVVGAGQMGRGIAQVAAQAGCEVRLMDTNDAQVGSALVSIAKELNRLVSKGKLPDGASDKILGRIHPTRLLTELGTCEYVIEAAVENTELKLQIFREMDQVLAPNTILASNTSSISLTKLAGATKRPERVIGMHFMNPVPLMKLVEIVRALQTAEDTYQETCKLSQKLGKTYVTTRDMPGFIVNRMLIPFINEACFTLQDGLGTVEDIDEAARLGLNHPMGPLQLADLIGLDTCLFITEVLQREFGEDKYRPSSLLRNYVAAGWLGRKTSRGFYIYSAGKQERPSGRPAPLEKV
ncbi:MAG TPA: 3-hydroxyacyl-CoA dehydrogenase NAD-binding domain-containing protein [Polyangiaceae bacterium]|jgi:3-hydroxybutyryl-CoA dehydrogenase|nr:3-hydroxyacyl-CoA dehydrogenase NAD-binding domain-containing protein [Polyangiaceae bacterium]